MKIKQLKEKTIKGFIDFLPKIGINDIEGLLDAINDKLSKSQGGEIKKPIVVTNDDSNYKTIINPDGSIYILNKNTNTNVFSLINTNKGVTINNNNVYSPIRVNNIGALYDKHGNVLYNDTSNLFYANGFIINNGTDKQVLLGDGSTTDRLIKNVTAEAIQSEYNFNFITTSNANKFVTINAATSTTAGVMTAADKTKLDNVPNIYAEKSKAISNITVGNRQNKRGLYIAIDYADRTNPGTTVNIPNVTTTSDGCMSYEDKKTLDAVKTTYLPISGGKMTGTLYLDFTEGIRIMEHDLSPRNTYIGNGSIKIESLDGDTSRVTSKTEIDSNSITTTNATVTHKVKANGFLANNNGNDYTAWTTNGGSIDLINLLKNAAIYVAGGFELAESGLNDSTVVDNPDSIIFDRSLLGGRFLARKGLVCYFHWKADISKNIAPPSRYGIETDNGVFPFNNQMYKFSQYNDIYIATCLNGTCSMEKLTLE